MGRLGDSWELMMVTLKLIRKDKTILLYPLISGIVSVIIAVTFIAGIFFSGFLGFFFTPFAIILYFMLYFILFFIGLYFNTAIVAYASIRLEGGQPTLGAGIRVANENLGAIIKWALVGGTIGLILKAVEKKVGVLGQFVISLIGFAWSMATFFIIPVLIYEKKPMTDSIKRSAGIFKDTWGETLIGHFAFSIFFVILAVLGIFFIIIGLMLGGFIGFLVGLILAIIYWVFIACLAISAQGVLVAVLYRFAVTRKIHPDFPEHLVRSLDSKIEYDSKDYFAAPVTDTGTFVEKKKPVEPPAAPGAVESDGVSISSGIELSGPGADLPEEAQAVVSQYMELFGLNEARATNLYKAGYKTIDDLKDALPEDLVIVDKINPTVARSIVRTLKGE